jgi:hypothetical protein
MLEKVYTVLAYAYKYFFAQIITDFEWLYEYYCEKLFSAKNKHIRRFSIDSFSYIIKKMTSEQRKKAFAVMLRGSTIQCAEQTG